MRFFIALFLAVLVVFVGVQTYRLFRQSEQSREQATLLEREADQLSAENIQLSKDVQYYRVPQNASKELQSKANYHQPDEKLIILVPAE